METRSCRQCVYAGRSTGRWLKIILLRWPGLLFCTNCAEAPGELRDVPATGSCRNFRPRRGPVVRLAPPKPPNDEIRYIPLTRGKFAIVDAADYERLSKHKWLASGDEHRGFYAARRVGSRLVLMHRVIMNPPEGMVVDHIDGNGLNNRRSNLRLCTQKQNSRNSAPSRRSSSRFKGVYFKKRTGKWIATIGYNGKTIHLGSFDDEIEAARAYDRKARELFGEFAYLNFPEEGQAVGCRPETGGNAIACVSRLAPTLSFPRRRESSTASNGVWTPAWRRGDRGAELSVFRRPLHAALETLDDVTQAHDRMLGQHTRSGVAHHPLNATPHLRLIAMNRTLRARPLIGPERTSRQPPLGITQQFVTLSAQRPRLAVMMPRTIHPHHDPNRPLFLFQALTQLRQNQTILSYSATRETLAGAIFSVAQASSLLMTSIETPASAGTTRMR